MRIAHWTLKNNSGMHRVAASLAKAEKVLGFDSDVYGSDITEEHDRGVGADVHVCHTHVPDKAVAAGGKFVYVMHGTPEHMFQSSIEAGLTGQYAPSNSFMMMQYWLQHADKVVTFWPRHKVILDTMCDKGRSVTCIPLGIEKEFWRETESLGKYLGEPSVFSAENCHPIKWPLDLALSWPLVTKEVIGARLHLAYIPLDQQMFWHPLMNRNGSAYTTIFGRAMEHQQLRNVFKSVDFYLGLVRYGDYNRIALEAAAAGCKVISFAGNPYAHYWIPEGDQRHIAEMLIEIFKGNIEPREAEEVVDASVTAQHMKGVYESLFESGVASPAITPEIAKGNGDGEETHEPVETSQKVV